VTDTVTGRIVELRDEALVFEIDGGERIVLELEEQLRLRRHELVGVVGGPVRVMLTIDGSRPGRTASAVSPVHQPHP